MKSGKGKGTFATCPSCGVCPAMVARGAFIESGLADAKAAPIIGARYAIPGTLNFPRFDVGLIDQKHA